MNEHPILFSAPMVKAILEGRKTQTRRIIKPQPVRYDGSGWKPPLPYGFDWRGVLYPNDNILSKSPYGIPGDHLWVRETWRQCCCLRCNAQVSHGEKPIHEYEYRADGDETPGWRPSIFMPRSASRLTLEVVRVRVERLHEISEEDIRAEGTPTPNPPPNNWMDDSKWRATFAYLWDSINEKRAFGWDTNPWVWVVEFKRLH